MKRWLLAALLLPITAWAQSIPASDPTLTAAVRSFKAGNYAAAKPLFDALASKYPGDKTPQTYLSAIALQEKKNSSASLEAALRSTIIPKVEFNDVSVREAIGYVAQRVKELSNGSLILNVVYLIPAESDYRVTLSLQEDPATEVMKYIAEASGVRLEYDAHAVKVLPPASAPAK